MELLIQLVRKNLHLSGKSQGIVREFPAVATIIVPRASWFSKWRFEKKEKNLGTKSGTSAILAEQPSCTITRKTNEFAFLRANSKRKEKKEWAWWRKTELSNHHTFLYAAHDRGNFSLSRVNDFTTKTSPVNVRRHHNGHLISFSLFCYCFCVVKQKSLDLDLCLGRGVLRMAAHLPLPWANILP